MLDIASAEYAKQQPKEEDVPGQLPASVTYDPTQGQGTAAWQASLRHSMQLNARERRN